MKTEEFKIGKRIKELRLSKKIKQKDLAIKLDMPISTLANYETDRRPVSIDTLHKIADTLEVSIYDLMEPQTEKDMLMKSVSEIEKKKKNDQKETDILTEQLLKRFNILNNEGKKEILKRFDELRMNKNYRSDQGFSTGLIEEDRINAIDRVLSIEEIERSLPTVEEIKRTMPEKYLKKD